MHAVQFIDWCKKERLRELYRCADCFTAPSHREGMSNAVLEAMACGLPVICGDCEGNREVIVDGKNGFLVAAGDVAALSERMLFCSDNRQKAAEIGAAARKYCCERFSWSMAAHKLTLLLEERRQTVETI
jgi:glycosyltransferase involved in cell wall biosynthesis